MSISIIISIIIIYYLLFFCWQLSAVKTKRFCAVGTKATDIVKRTKTKCE